MPRSRHSAFTARRLRSCSTAPLGLFGEIVTIARVRAVIAAAIASTFS